MNVFIIELHEQAPRGVTNGFVLCLGNGDKEIVFLCETSNMAQVIQFQADFCSKTGFYVRKYPVTVLVHNEIAAIWQPLEP